MRRSELLNFLGDWEFDFLLGQGTFDDLRFFVDATEANLSTLCGKFARERGAIGFDVSDISDTCTSPALHVSVRLLPPLSVCVCQSPSACVKVHFVIT